MRNLPTRFCEIKMEFISDKITEFLSIMTEVRTRYDYAKQQMGRCEQATQDILHKIELGNLKYKERARAATKLQLIRQDRRYYKDMVELYEPLVNFLENQQYQKAINVLSSDTLGQVRKVEKYHAKRSYKPKIIKDEE